MIGYRNWALAVFLMVFGTGMVIADIFVNAGANVAQIGIAIGTLGTGVAGIAFARGYKAGRGE